ncbi:cilia- and flagella-associated protein 61 isoform X2 [Drosophila biarmipes]|uniref:cilia- and flagella-associated protein 61 isoform X2 n=1 Tax=Drosophila biarmipes TaxID=125945 RepID=UPI0021CC5604|nr:cilia- and flagella-associated protein 61 isoform X2 [Drosophila biarmipes]
MYEFDVRLAQVADLDEINKLIRSPGVRWFGNIRPKFRGKHTLFHSYQTYRMVALCRQSSELVAYAEVRNYPSISALPTDCWLEWLSVRYCLTVSISWLNALFFNFCIYKSEYSAVLVEIVKEVLYRENRVWYLIAVRTPYVRQPFHFNETFDDLEKIAKVYYPREFSTENNPNTQSLCIVHRFDILRKITYRKALPEDNDEIIALQAIEMPKLREELGEFYIAEEVMRQDADAEKSLLVVAETANQCEETDIAIFLWLTTDIDILFYVRNYEVEQFGNLVKPADSKSFHYETLTVSAEASMFTTDALEDLDAMTILGGLQRIDSGMSVASAGKMKVSSIGGTIDDTVTAGENKFFMREGLYSKFKYILEKLRSTEYYLRHEQSVMNFIYPAGKEPAGPAAREAASNVFVLKCIVARPDFPLPRLFNAMVAMFGAYPDRDYCMMVMTAKKKANKSYLEVLQYFMPVVSRPSNVSNIDEVYITHRSTIFGDISLYKLEKEDVSLVHKMALGNLDKDVHSADSSSSSFSYCSKINEREELEHELRFLDAIMKDVLENEFSEFSVFTIRCGNSTRPAKENTSIGFVVLRQFHSYAKLFDHYHLPRHDNHLDRRRAEIIAVRLHPLFLVSADLIFRDLARKTNFCDFYFISAFDGYKYSNDLKKMMMVIEPKSVKKAPVFSGVNVDQKKPKSRLHVPMPNFAKDYLIIYRHKLNPVKWFTNSRKLVVIGFGALTKAFLRLLVFQWNSKDHKNSENYTCLSRLQVTVICRPGIVEADYDSLFKCPYCTSTLGCYLSYQNESCFVRDCCLRMDLRHWVHFVPGKVQQINREKKLVKLETCEIHYDTLLLMCDRMFVLRSPETPMGTGRPSNLVELNFRLNKFMLFYKVRALLEHMPRTYLVVVYGSNLYTYECIAFLIGHGVDCSRMIFVQPHRYTGREADMKEKNPYWDKNLQLVLDEILEDKGVSIFLDYDFHHYNLHKSSDFIMEVIFQHFPSRKQATFECDLFISFEEGHLNQRHKNFLRSAKIEFEGNEILVDEQYRTNDPNIYAFGSFVRIRKTPNYQYRFVSERELSRKILHYLGIVTQKNFEDRFSEPQLFQAILPLRYFITKVTMPRRYLQSHLNVTENCNMTTYKDNTFCRVALSTHKIVDEIVVVTKMECHLDFLHHFCGKHELLLNKLRSRFKARTIHNFLKYFQEPWTELIMHENFEDLQEENKALLTPMASSALSRAERGALGDVTDMDFFTLNKRYMEIKILDFLREHRRDFRHKFALPEDFHRLDLPDSDRHLDTEESDVSSDSTET